LDTDVSEKHVSSILKVEKVLNLFLLP
jgi:hypothetical protein